MQYDSPKEIKPIFQGIVILISLFSLGNHECSMKYGVVGLKTGFENKRVFNFNGSPLECKGNRTLNQLEVYVVGGEDDSVITYSYPSFISEMQRLRSIGTTCNGKEISKTLFVSSRYLNARENVCGMKAVDIWCRRVDIWGRIKLRRNLHTERWP